MLETLNFNSTMSPEGVGGGGGMQGVSDEFTITATTNSIPATCALCCVCTKIQLQEEAGMFHDQYQG